MRCVFHWEMPARMRYCIKPFWMSLREARHSGMSRVGGLFIRRAGPRPEGCTGRLRSAATKGSRNTEWILE
ncbi:histidinol-phosphate aminotransferase 1 domain protein [Burkholderia pseudomallei MSHR7343]|nr:histidinol-phosphate aminotransferase 1 domain protein [Burkholderia pseudomallei MSHR7343]